MFFQKNGGNIDWTIYSEKSQNFPTTYIYILSNHLLLKENSHLYHLRPPPQTGAFLLQVVEITLDWHVTDRHEPWQSLQDTNPKPRNEGMAASKHPPCSHAKRCSFQNKHVLTGHLAIK